MELKIQDFVKEKEAKGLLSNLGIKIPLSKIPLLNEIIKFHYSIIKIEK